MNGSRWSKEQGAQKLCHTKNDWGDTVTKSLTPDTKSLRVSQFNPSFTSGFIFLNLHQTDIIRILPHRDGLRMKRFNSHKQIAKTFYESERKRNMKKHYSVGSRKERPQKKT